MEIKLYNDDCLERMKEIEDKSVDLICCDLPYGVVRCKWDSVIDPEKLWEQYNRVIKDNGAIILFGDGMFTATMMTTNPKMWRYNLIWKKANGTDFLNANRKPLKIHEDIMVFYKKQPTYNKQYWYGKPYRSDSRKRNKLSENWGEFTPIIHESKDGRRNPVTVLEYPSPRKGNHPTEKPVELLEWIVKTYSNEGETVLDNCCGSGSLGVACINTNRNAILIEKEEKYYETSKHRLEEAAADKQSVVDFLFVGNEAITDED